jgi:hypothetical protein
LGKEDNTEDWYFPALSATDHTDNWVDQIVEPKTNMFLRVDFISAANPDPRALATVDPDENQCLKIRDSRTSNTGSIWLFGERVSCD